MASRDDLWSTIERLGDALDRLRNVLRTKTLDRTILTAWKAKERQLLRKLQLASDEYFLSSSSSVKVLGSEQRLEELGRKLDHMRDLRAAHPEGSSAYRTLDIICQKLQREYEFLASKSTNRMVESMRSAWKKMF